MKKAIVNVTAPVYFAAGEWLNGVVLTGSCWVRSGTAEVSAERAAELSTQGYADVLSVDGADITWGACCGGAHEH